MKNLLRTIVYLYALALASVATAGETFIDVGPAHVGADYLTGVWGQVTERFDDKYDLTIGYITEQHFNSCEGRPDCEWTVQAQIFVGAQINWPVFTNRAKFGIGPYYVQNANRVTSCNFVMGLSLEYRITDNWGLNARHMSNAGTCPHKTVYNNLGIPFIVRANMGQDSWLRLVKYF